MAAAFCRTRGKRALTRVKGQISAHLKNVTFCAPRKNRPTRPPSRACGGQTRERIRTPETSLNAQYVGPQPARNPVAIGPAAAELLGATFGSRFCHKNEHPILHTNQWGFREIGFSFATRSSLNLLERNLDHLVALVGARLGMCDTTVSRPRPAHQTR
jgi:hypothetical protein